MSFSGKRCNSMKQDKRFNYKEAEESGKKFVRYKDGFLFGECGCKRGYAI